MPEKKMFPFDEAVRKSIQTEKYAMEFYRTCAEYMKNPESVKLFALLAREEREHAESFYQVYFPKDIPDFAAFMETVGGNTSGWLAELGKSAADLSEREAMLFAMEKEKQLEQGLRELAATVEEPTMRAVYEENLHSTHNHYLLIEAEYARLMAMVHETDMDIFVRE